MTQSSNSLDQLGALIDDRYRLEEFLGSGPVHRAYAAFDTFDGVRVCLKIPGPSSARTKVLLLAIAGIFWKL